MLRSPMPATGSQGPAWQGLPVWRILDTDFGNGQAFFNTWRNWQSDSEQPRVLHYVALCTVPVPARGLTKTGEDNPRLQPLAHELAAQWFGLLPGFHRFLLARGQVILTLCVGDTLKVLRQQHFEADELQLSVAASAPDDALVDSRLWLSKALARCCRRGTILHCSGLAREKSAEWAAHLKQCGFIVQIPQKTPSGQALVPLDAVFDPPWPLKTSRQHELTTALPIQRCAVIGAGLAGASVAAALARRGWRVQVLDQAATPAAGASGLPVGLVVPHVSSDDCSLSRLSRAGVRLMLQQARLCLAEGQQWSPSGVLERQVGGTPRLPSHWPSEGHDWSTHGIKAPSAVAAAAPGPALWHPKGAWLKPAELVRAWLRQPGVTFLAQAKVTGLRRVAEGWELLDETGAVLCSAERVVLANACGAFALLPALAQHDPALAAQLKKMPSSQGMRGLLSEGRHADTTAANQAFAPLPVNGNGSVIPHIGVAGESRWFVGSSYQPETQAERSDADNHARNFDHLQQLLPTLANQLEASFSQRRVTSWKGTRCIMADRLPVVGPLDGGSQPSLWICAGLGSRGMSFSVLCAELLAARMGAEPLPVEANLAQALNALRA